MTFAFESSSESGLKNAQLNDSLPLDNNISIDPSQSCSPSNVSISDYRKSRAGLHLMVVVWSTLLLFKVKFFGNILSKIWRESECPESDTHEVMGQVRCLACVSGRSTAEALNHPMVNRMSPDLPQSSLPTSRIMFNAHSS